MALAAVWAATILLLAGTVVWLELRYRPADETQSHPAPERDGPAADAGDRGAAGTAVPRLPEPDVAAAETADPRTAADGTAPAEPDPPTPASPAEIRLTPAPVAELSEDGPDGPLPVEGPSGRPAWQAYSRPFLDGRGAARIALVVQEIGLSERATAAAIEELPPAVTLAISPYAPEPAAVARRARGAGHEVLLMVPMEPFDYPANDPGPHTLLVDMPEAEMLARLHFVMSRFQGYVGLVNHMGSRFTADAQALAPVMADLAGRGVLFLDARTTPDSVLPDAARGAGVPVLVNDRYIDNDVAPEAIDGHLEELLAIAREEGAAIGIGRPYPVTLRRIAAFAGRLEAEEAVLAPVSAILDMERAPGRRAARQ